MLVRLSVTKLPRFIKVRLLLQFCPLTSALSLCPGASRSPSSSPRPQQSPQHRAQPKAQSNASKPASYTKEEQRKWVEANVCFVDKNSTWFTVCLVNIQTPSTTKVTLDIDVWKGLGLPLSLICHSLTDSSHLYPYCFFSVTVSVPLRATVII